MRRNWIVVVCLGLAVIFITSSVKAQGRRRGVVTSGARRSVNSEAGKQVKCIGRVVDTDGQPVGGAKVGLYGLTINMGVLSYEAELVQEVTTKDDGAFTIEAAKDGSHLTGQSVILAEKEGLAISWANWYRRENLDVEMKLGRPQVLMGKVVDESGSPVSDAEVSISFMMLGGEHQRYMAGQVSEELLATSTDVEGKFAFGRLPGEASAELVVKKPGRATISTFDSTGYGGGGLRYVPGQDDIRIEMPVEAKVEGVVVEKGTGKPAGGVKLIVTQGQHQPNFGQEPVVSNEDGAFSINSLAAGRHILQLVMPKEEVADWVAEPVEVTAEAGKTKSGVKVEVSKGGLLEVVVTDATTKKPLESATVSIQQEGGGQWSSGVRSDKDGVARIRLLAGKYRLTWVYKEGYAQGRQQEEVRIEDNGTERIEVGLAGQPKITGVVRDEDGKPVEGAKLRVCPVAHQDSTSDAEGKFEVSWNPRGWGGEDMVCYLVARHEERNLAAALEVDEDITTLDVKLGPGVILTGRVVDPNGKGIPDAKINVMLRASRWGAPIVDRQQGGARADAEGRFEVKAIPPEHKYSVTAMAEGYGQNQKEAPADEAVANRLDLGQLTLKVANLSVSGVVVDADDKPVSGADIGVHGEGQSYRRARTDEEGKFTVEEVCAGSLRVNASVRGERRLHGNAVAEGGATDVKIVVYERSPGRPVPKQAASLVGKSLPELKDLKVELSEADVNDKMILVCFWDMGQRASRHLVRELAKRAEELKQKDVVIAAVQASPVDPNALAAWIEKYDISYPVGLVEGDAEKTNFAWGVRGLPWLILTDPNHIVSSDGFMLWELDKKLKQIGGE